MFVDGFEDIPVAVDVQPLCGAFVSQADGFGGPVVIADSTAERRADQLTFRGGERFACGVDQHRVDVQPAGLLLMGQSFQSTGIAAQARLVEKR